MIRRHKLLCMTAIILLTGWGSPEPDDETDSATNGAEVLTNLRPVVNTSVPLADWSRQLATGQGYQTTPVLLTSKSKVQLAFKRKTADLTLGLTVYHLADGELEEVHAVSQESMDAPGAQAAVINFSLSDAENAKPGCYVFLVEMESCPTGGCSADLSVRDFPINGNCPAQVQL